MTGTAGVAQPKDFYRSGTTETVLPDGTVDTTEQIGHQGRLAVGANLGTDPTLPLTQQSDLVVAGAITGGVADVFTSDTTANLSTSGHLFNQRGEKTLYPVNALASPNNFIGVTTGNAFQGRTFFIYNTSTTNNLSLRSLGFGLFYQGSRTLSGGQNNMLLQPGGLLKFTGFGSSWLVESVAANGCRTQGVTDANGEFQYSFEEPFVCPVSMINPDVSVGPAGLPGNDLTEVRVTALSQTSVTVQVLRYPVVVVSGISVMGAASPAVGVQVNVDVRTQLGGG